MDYFKKHRVIIFAVVLSAAVHAAVFAKAPSPRPPAVEKTVIKLELMAPAPDKRVTARKEKAPSEEKVTPLKKSEPKKNPTKKIAKTEPEKMPVKKIVEDPAKIPEPAKEPEPSAEIPAHDFSEEAAVVPQTDMPDAGGYVEETVSASAMSSSPEAVYIDANYDAIRRLFMRELEYPDKARRMGLEGKGSVTLVIDKDGKIKSVSLSDEFGSRMLNEAALKAGKRVRKVTAPGLDEVRIVIPVTFSLY